VKGRGGGVKNRRVGFQTHDRVMRWRTEGECEKKGGKKCDLTSIPQNGGEGGEKNAPPLSQPYTPGFFHKCVGRKKKNVVGIEVSRKRKMLAKNPC